MAFRDWQQKRYGITEDARRTPKGETLAEHRRHCRAKPSNCPFEKEADKADSLPSATPSKCTDFKATVKDLYDRAQREGFTHEIIAALKAADKEVRSGRQPPMRMPGDSMGRRGVKKLPLWFRAAYHMLASAAKPAYNQKPHGDTMEARREESVLERYCKSIGAWHDDLYGECQSKYGQPFDTGAEAACYDAGDSVVKATDLSMTTEPIRAMERIMLHNFYFPESAVEILGMGRLYENGPFGILTRQRKFKFDPKPVDIGEKLDFMADRGFLVRDGVGDEYVSIDKSIVSGDLHKDNIRWTTDGKIVVPDSYTSLNIPEYNADGKYDLDNPPKRLFRENDSDSYAHDEAIETMKEEEQKDKDSLIESMFEEVGDIRESHYWRQDVDDALSKTDPRTISWQYLHDHAHCNTTPKE